MQYILQFHCQGNGRGVSYWKNAYYHIHVTEDSFILVESDDLAWIMKQLEGHNDKIRRFGDSIVYDSNHSACNAIYFQIVQRQISYVPIDYML